MFFIWALQIALDQVADSAIVATLAMKIVRRKAMATPGGMTNSHAKDFIQPAISVNFMVIELALIRILK
jgi:hypothetical protein